MRYCACMYMYMFVCIHAVVLRVVSALDEKLMYICPYVRRPGVTTNLHLSPKVREIRRLYM